MALPEEPLPEFQAPALKVPLPKFPLEKEKAYSQAWPEHLNRQDPFARYRKGASRYYAPAKFDPFKEWRDPDEAMEGVSTPVPFTAAQPPEFPELDDSAPSRCGRCGSTLAAENNFCGRCGLARSTDRGYQHPEKLLPGPPLRHDASQPGPMIKPALGPSSGRPGPPGSLGPPPGTVRPGGVCPGPGGPLLGPPKGTIKSSCRPMNRKHCAPAMGPVCG
ncbi:unnamed protein product [Durusdinium trenchii]|uniref:Zinc ribbon domain-containing protein n=1 Tax=Durusdinium trenchii TaxID=1381693 RepID=A0ABP0P229_9DINO